MKSIISHTIAALTSAVIIAAFMQPKKCTKVHLKPYEYRVIVDGTDSILRYTFIADGTDTIVKDICAEDLDYELNLEQ